MSAPPDRALTWASEIAGSPVVSADPVTGGITATKWILRLADGSDLVLRWSSPEVWGAVGQEHVRREAWAGRVLAGSEVPVPGLLGTDLDGSATGGFAELLTWLPGRTRLDPLGSAALESWAALAVTVHAQQVPPPDRPPTFTFRGSPHPEVPTWTRRPELWRAAIDVWEAGAPRTQQVLLHRDFHLGNVLWEGDVVSGLVDWAETSWGPADLDVAHACADLAMLHTVQDAGTFRNAYVSAGGRLDPGAAAFWVVADVLGFLPDPAHILPGLQVARPDVTADGVRQGLEELLAHTLQR